MSNVLTAFRGKDQAAADGIQKIRSFRRASLRVTAARYAVSQYFWGCCVVQLLSYKRSWQSKVDCCWVDRRTGMSRVSYFRLSQSGREAVQTRDDPSKEKIGRTYARIPEFMHSQLFPKSRVLLCSSNLIRQSDSFARIRGAT